MNEGWFAHLLEIADGALRRECRAADEAVDSLGLVLRHQNRFIGMARRLNHHHVVRLD